MNSTDELIISLHCARIVHHASSCSDCGVSGVLPCSRRDLWLELLHTILACHHRTDFASAAEHQIRDHRSACCSWSLPRPWCAQLLSLSLRSRLVPARRSSGRWQGGCGTRVCRRGYALAGCPEYHTRLGNWRGGVV